MPGDLERRLLGRTGRAVSILGLGGRHLARVRQAEVIRAVRTAVDAGVTLFETASAYGSGRVLRWMAQALREAGRPDVTVLVGNCAYRRDYKSAMLELETLLSLLKVDSLDAWYFHDLNYDNDPDWLHDHGGIDAALEAKVQGKVRWIGFACHKAPHIARKALARDEAWDLALVPLNPLDAHFRSFEKEVLPELVRRGIGIVGTKPLCGGALTGPRPVTPGEALRYAWSLPVAGVVCGMGSAASVRRNALLARRYAPWKPGEMDALRARTRAVAGDGRLERYKTSLDCDAPGGLEAHGYRPPNGRPRAAGRRPQ
jgi:aryl-alcohol dehydrogenase-like predicted oxidoreductase